MQVAGTTSAGEVREGACRDPACPRAALRAHVRVRLRPAGRKAARVIQDPGNRRKAPINDISSAMTRIS